jgi:hypothetical protein
MSPEDIIRGLKQNNPATLHTYAQLAAELLARLTTVQKIRKVPPHGRTKTNLRVMLEEMPPGHTRFFAMDTFTLQKVIDRIRRAHPTARYNVRKQEDGANVYRRT